MKKSALIIFMLFHFPLHAFSYELIIPDTGQVLCYNWDKIMCDTWHMEGFVQVCDSLPYCPVEGEDFYGQDACYVINPPDLTDNGDGTVTDNLTGLVWEQKTATDETFTFSYGDALTHCDTLSLAGQNDWRLPTRQEFSTILNFSRVSPALDVAYFPYFTYNNSYEVFYWTSTEYHNDASKVWGILLSFGLIQPVGKTENPLKVRCVRGNALPASSYTDNGDGTVTDSVTGYMWEQKTDDGGSRDKDNLYTWNNALIYCENLLLGGHDDWRLPNPKELERIAALGTSNPAIETDYFPNTNSGLYWTGTSCSKCHYKKAFSIDFADGELYYGNKYSNQIYYENYVRCVRHPDPDNDTILYPNDNCPLAANPGQEDAGDGDGAGDACDNCLTLDNPDQSDSYPPGGNNCGDACECEGNFDGNTNVDGTDAATFKADFGRSNFLRPCAGDDPCNGDFTCNGNVDGSDAALFKSDFGRNALKNPCPGGTTEPWCPYP
jgi:hypothetical protein